MAGLVSSPRRTKFPARFCGFALTIPPSVEELRKGLSTDIRRGPGDDRPRLYLRVTHHHHACGVCYESAKIEHRFGLGFNQRTPIHRRFVRVPRCAEQHVVDDVVAACPDTRRNRSEGVGGYGRAGKAAEVVVVRDFDALLGLVAVDDLAVDADRVQVGQLEAQELLQCCGRERSFCDWLSDLVGVGHRDVAVHRGLRRSGGRRGGVDVERQSGR